MTSAKQAAREAIASPTVRALARAGFAANGLVHVLIGAIVLAVALGGEGKADQAGAFEAVASAPLGFVALWVVAVALWGLALWHLAAGLIERGDGHWGRRVSEWGQALVFAAVGAISASVALGARPDADEAAQDTSRGLLAFPGGVFLLGAVGVGVAIAGVAFVVMGVRRSFRKKMSIPTGRAGTGIDGLGVVGFVAKGIALAIVGVLLVVAAIKANPEEAGGLNSAIQALMAIPAGPWLAGVVGVGLIAYGIFCGFRARYARL